MQTITTREQLLVNGKVLERVATHIVTGAHGYETLCTGGYNLQYNQERVLVQNCEKLAEGELPITCHSCFAVWQDAYKFKDSDFDIKSGNFTDTGLTDITIGQISEPEEESVNILYADQYETLPIERYMTNEEVGRLVFNFMKRTNGEALLIVFPEYDNGDDNDDKNTRCVK